MHTKCLTCCLHDAKILYIGITQSKSIAALRFAIHFAFCEGTSTPIDPEQCVLKQVQAYRMIHL